MNTICRLIGCFVCTENYFGELFICLPNPDWNFNEWKKNNFSYFSSEWPKNQNYFNQNIILFVSFIYLPLLGFVFMSWWMLFIFYFLGWNVLLNHFRLLIQKLFMWKMKRNENKIQIKTEKSSISVLFYF